MSILFWNGKCGHSCWLTTLKRDFLKQRDVCQKLTNLKGYTLLGLTQKGWSCFWEIKKKAKKCFPIIFRRWYSDKSCWNTFLTTNRHINVALKIHKLRVYEINLFVRQTSEFFQICWKHCWISKNQSCRCSWLDTCKHGGEVNDTQTSKIEL